MIGTRCRLGWPDDQDYPLIAGWLRPTSMTAGLTGDTAEIVTAASVRELNEAGRVRYLMVLTNEGRPVGVVNYRRTNVAAGSFAIGGAIGDEDRWGSGIGFEALRLLVDHLFHGENAHRVEFATAAYNRHTMAMLTKGGFVLECVLRDFHYLDGTYHDRTVWAILRAEFEQGAVTYRDRFPVRDAVPQADKDHARACLVKYLATDPPTSIGLAAQRPAPARSY
jgi:RimJ/RimL family protein N-acetyltransferase